MHTILSLAVVTVAEASIGIFVKLVGDAVPIYTLNFYRVFFAALFLLAMTPLVRSASLRYPKQNTRDILIVGALIAAQISFFNIAMSLAPVANVVIFWSVAPFFVFIFSTLFLNEKPRPVYMWIFLLALVGIVTAEPISFADSLTSPTNLGNLIALFDGAIYAAMVTYMRFEGKTETSTDIMWFMIAASIYLSPALFIFGPGELMAMNSSPALPFAAPALVWAACLGVLSTGTAFLFISLVLHRINANIYSLVDIIVSPVIAALFAYAVFYEVPSIRTIIGGAILLVAAFLLTYLRNRAQSSQSQQVAVSST
jgi:drug/metabolite transporter (DMT)-like permease